MRVYSDDYTTIEHHLEQKYLKVVRTVPSDVPVEQYKQSFLEWLEIIKRYRPVFQLLDETENQRAISQEMQEWINSEILKPAYELGLRKLAVVVSRELLVSVSQENVLEEGAGQNFVIEYFSEPGMAEKWLLGGG